MIGSRKNVDIIGAGALGRATAALMAAEGLSVTLWTRHGKLRDVFTVFHNGNTLQFSPPDSAPNVEISLVVVATKAFDLPGALTQIEDRIASSSLLVVSLCNGAVWGALMDFQERSKHKVLLGTTTQAARYLGGGNVELGPVFQTSVGPLPGAAENPEARDFFAIPAFEKIHWQYRPDNFDIARRKWIMNCVANSVCAVHRLPRNGLLFQYRDEVEPGLAEAFALCQELWGELPFPLARIVEQFWTLIDQSQANENSMAVDVRCGRKTECDYLTGLAVGRDGYRRLKSWHAYLARS